jgi:DNA-binding transcriptional regulator YdaS (Cro superfamily)
MLDVDSWLREHPRDSNPTGRICARYVTLLRHICNYRDPEGRRHDALVIVAHSQGTVITADLLRFLRIEHQATKPPAKYDPGLERLLSGELPVYLFTMGCPLRQLYGLRFPYLYQWAHHERAAAPGNAPDIPRDTKPDPRELGVRSWTNVFRSGDYIGRHIWRTDDYPATASAEFSSNEKGAQFERCIGAGAHTHYWDETAPQVARILDEMVSCA